MSGSSGETLALTAAALIREQGGELGPVPRADLAKGVRDVTLDGLRRQEQGLRDIAVALAARRQAHDLALALGQAGQEISVGRRRPPAPGAHTEGRSLCSARPCCVCDPISAASPAAARSVSIARL